jgi:hypothetical protein
VELCCGHFHFFTPVVVNSAVYEHTGESSSFSGLKPKSVQFSTAYPLNAEPLRASLLFPNLDPTVFAATDCGICGACSEFTKLV